MINMTYSSNITGEPVTEQAPTPTAETPENISATSTATAKIASTPPATSTAKTVETASTADTTPTASPSNLPETGEAKTTDVSEIAKAAFAVTATHAPSPETAGNGLPAGYAVGGLLDENGIIRREYVGEYAKELAQNLKPLSATSFQRTFLTKAKEANKKKVPYSAKKNCAMNMVIQAQKLVHRKKEPAPAVLQEMMELATATVTDPATFEALYMHMDAVCTFMLCE